MVICGAEEVVVWMTLGNSLWKEKELAVGWGKVIGKALLDEGCLNSAQCFSTFPNPSLHLIDINTSVPFQILIFWPP